MKTIFTAQPKPQDHTSTRFPVEIILPKRWYRRAKYKLLEDVVVDGTVIPKGFITDGASTPIFIWPILPPIGKYFPAAVLHDYLLFIGQKRKDARRRFKAVLRATKTDRWQRILLVSGVFLMDVYRLYIQPLWQ